MPDPDPGHKTQEEVDIEQKEIDRTIEAEQRGTAGGTSSPPPVATPDQVDRGTKRREPEKP